MFYFLFTYEAGVEPSPLVLRQLIGLLYQPWMIDGDDCGAVGGMNDKGKPKYLEKTSLITVLSITNITWLGPGSNTGHRERKPAWTEDTRKSVDIFSAPAGIRCG
jgi:hypothetical protein